MMRSISVFLTLLMATCIVPSLPLSAANVIPYDNQQIEKIEITSACLPQGTEFDATAVLARMRTKRGDLFSHSTFDQDLKSLSQDFDRIEPSVDSIEGKIYIKIIVWPKPTIRTLWWNGNNGLTSTELQEELGIKIGSVFDRQSFNQAFHKLKAYYVKKGFFEVKLDYKVNPDATSGEVDIEIKIEEGRSGMIKEIVFCNFTSDEQSDVAELMVSKEWSMFFSWLTDEGIYREEAIQQDEMLILNYLQNAGYSDAQVKIDICEADAKNRILIKITANKGELYRFGKITFEGNCLFTQEHLEEFITFSSGDVYSPETLRDSIRALNELYGTYGYIDAIIDYEPRLNTSCHAHDIHVMIDEGQQYRVGLVRVFGNCVTQTHVILHEILLIPGEVFDLEKLRLSEDRLRSIGYFSSVNIYAVRSTGPCGLGDDYRDIHIEVEETSTGTIGLSFGFSTVENLFGGLNISEHNFYHGGWGCLRQRGYQALRGGGEFLRLDAQISQRSRRYALSWTQPHFMDSDWSIGFDVEQSNTRYISRDYDINALGLSLHAKREINAFVRFGWHYRLRNTNVNITEENPSQLLIQEARNAGLISATGVSLIYNSTNNATKPTSGTRSSLSLEYAGLGGDHSFAGLAYLNTFYLPAGKCGVVKYRIDGRFIQPLWSTSASEVPLDERLFLGGDSTIRGYRPYALGPQFPGGGADPRGGMTLLLLSAEYMHPIFKKLDGFVFADAGHLSFDTWDLTGELKASVGFGGRLTIMDRFPPFEFGIGFPLNSTNRSETKRFFFAIGGRF